MEPPGGRDGGEPEEAAKGEARSGEPTDVELLGAWASGDKSCGRKLYRRHHRVLVRFFYNKVGHETADLVQNTFLAVVEGASSYRGEGSFRSWLLGIGHRVLYKHFEARYRNGPPVEHRSVVDMGSSPSALAARHEQHRLLLDALRRLPLQQQVALELHYWEGMTNQQIAEVLGLPLGTVQSRIRRAREQLEKVMTTLDGASEHLSAEGGFDGWAANVRGAVLDAETE